VHLLRQVAAAALACLALVLALRSPAPAAGAAPGETPVLVAVAAADLPAGTVLTADDLATVSLPAGAAPAGTIRSDELAGQVMASPVRAGEVITDVRVVGPGLWSQVPDGQIAAPVRLADLAVATLLRAGDRVDVLAAVGDGVIPSVQVVAEGALVLTVPATETGDGVATSAADGSGLLVLAVAPETAQRLAAAGAAATLTVTLGRP
jgi:pilus assembly protein CpaB